MTSPLRKNINSSSKNFKVLVGYPPLKKKSGAIATLGQNRQFQYFKVPTLIQPLLLSSAATLIKKEGYPIIWRDCIAEDIDKKEFFRYIEKERPNLFLFETKTPVIKEHWRMINELKEKFPDMRIAICGDHVTALPEESFKESDVDFVITGGDYDFSLLELCDSLNHKKKLPAGIYYLDPRSKKIKHNKKFKLNHDLNSLPFIDRELTRWEDYQREYNIVVRPYAYIMSARDCWYGKCKFCVWPQTIFPKPFRKRSVNNVLDEIGMLIKKHKVREIFDDSGTFPIGNWLKDFCNGMIERGYNKKINFSCNMRFGILKEEDYKLMKKAGFRLLKFGLESANQKTLNKLNKGIKVGDIIKGCKLAKKAGLIVHVTEMVSWPWETKKDATETYKLINYLITHGLADVHQCTTVVPYPGTSLWEEAIKKGLFLINPKDYEKYDMNQPILKTKMKVEEVMEIYRKIYRTYLHPRYIIRASIRNIKHPIYLLSAFRSVIGHLQK